jgi:hypothetical protein
MQLAKRYSLSIFAVLLFSILSSQDVIGQQKKIKKGSGAAKEIFQPVDPSELSFSMKTKELWWEQGGKKASGTIAEFSFEGQKLALNTEKIDNDGFIDTRDYGKIKIQGANIMGGFSVFLTPSQKEKFLQLKEELKKAKPPLRK